MRWTSRGRSRDLEDRRGQSGLRRAAPIGIGGLLILGVLSLITGQDFLSMADPGGGPSGTSTSQPYTPTPEEEKLADFVSFVLDDSQDVWTQLLGPNYQRARLVLFNDAVESTCGYAESATGPFYCPADQRVYIDLGFYRELQQRFGAPGDFAQAYVLAHEIGHHVQTLTGTAAEVRRAQSGNPSRANDLSVRMELQADCYAGVWAHTTSRRGLLEEDDIEEALDAAAAIGDDRIQRMGGGRVAPERFTHGSSAQRMEWFRRGFDTGRPDACDTFQ
jgi:predicted metalloprotease